MKDREGDMKRILMLFIVLLTVQINAQTISNMRWSKDPDCGYYKIIYDINGKTNDGFTIELTASNGKQELKNPKGMSGRGISELCFVGKDNIIFWNPRILGYKDEEWNFTLNFRFRFYGIHNFLGYKDEEWNFTLNLKKTNFVFVEGGTFLMGSNDSDREKPVHTVKLSSFYIDKYEVTQKEWKEIMGDNPSYYRGDDLPVESVSWFDAIAYCNKKSFKEGLTPCYSYLDYGSNPDKWPQNWNKLDGNHTKINFNCKANGYRLPTEAEWEYAAKGGIQSKGYIFSGSNDANTVAWFENNAIQTHKIGTKKPNELGLYDMSGNVGEWCWDIYGDYPSGPCTNPQGASSGTSRVTRGGHWYYHATVANRSYVYATDSYSLIGLRVCRNSP